MKIIELVKNTKLSVKQTLRRLDIYKYTVITGLSSISEMTLMDCKTTSMR